MRYITGGEDPKEYALRKSIDGKNFPTILIENKEEYARAYKAIFLGIAVRYTGGNNKNFCYYGSYIYGILSGWENI